MLKYLLSINDIVGPMLDAMPHPVFLVNNDIAIVGLNKASRKMIGKEPEVIIRRRAGEILHCIHSKETEEGCGYSDFCNDCIIRNSVNQAFRGQTIVRKKVKMEMVYPDKIEKVYLSIITSPFEHNEKLFVLLQFENITELTELRGLIPICCICHNIREDNEYWHRIDSYFHKYLDLQFTHSICPKCTQKHYPELDV